MWNPQTNPTWTITAESEAFWHHYKLAPKCWLKFFYVQHLPTYVWVLGAASLGSEIRFPPLFSTILNNFVVMSESKFRSFRPKRLATKFQKFQAGNWIRIREMVPGASGNGPRKKWTPPLEGAPKVTSSEPKPILIEQLETTFQSRFRCDTKKKNNKNGHPLQISNGSRNSTTSPIWLKLCTLVGFGLTKM